MPTVEYPKSANVETAFVTDDNGHRTRAVKTVLLDGTIDYPKNANSKDCYVTVDGKKQRAIMTVDVSNEGSLEYPNNSNSTKGYVTVNGKKQRVVLTAALSGGGIIPTGTLNIPANGVYDVTDYASADVQVPTTAPAHYIEKTVDANGRLVNGATQAIDLTGVTDVGNYVLYYAYYSDTNLTGVIDLSSITNLSGSNCCQYTFVSCSSITGVKFSSLISITGYRACSSMFYGGERITSVDMGLLTTIVGQNACEGMFTDCYELTSIVFYSLTILRASSIFSVAFSRSGLTTLSFLSLTPNSFGSFTNQFSSMLLGVTGCTIHFPANLDPQGGSTVISSLITYPDFGGTNTVLAFDLPSTFTLTGADAVTYTRNPKYDTATALAWKVGAYGTTNFTPAYYTSGTTDPQVNDTIYSDDACTTAVTTISAIA